MLGGLEGLRGRYSSMMHWQPLNYEVLKSSPSIRSRNPSSRSPATTPAPRASKCRTFVTARRTRPRGDRVRACLSQRKETEAICPPPVPSARPSNLLSGHGTRRAKLASAITRERRARPRAKTEPSPCFQSARQLRLPYSSASRELHSSNHAAFLPFAGSFRKWVSFIRSLRETFSIELYFVISNPATFNIFHLLSIFLLNWYIIL